MRFDDQRDTDSIEDRRGGDGSGGGGFGFGGGGGGGLGGFAPALLGMVFSRFGCGGVVVVGALMLLFGGGLSGLGGLLGGGGGNVGPAQQQIGPQDTAPAVGPGGTRPEGANQKLVRNVIVSTEDVWTKLLPAQANVQYSRPRLVLFDKPIRSGCGTAESSMGPFYCPSDRKVYLDLGFFDELSQRFGSPGDAAQAYVIAHEVGHHIQKLLGITDQVEAAQERASRSQRNAISVRLELQADCFAGVWAKASGALEAGDVEEALRAATAIGDDTLQRQGQGRVVPDSFTHGSSADRVRWLQTGLQSGEVARCDTFKGGV